MTTPPDQTLYRTRPFTLFWVVFIEHLRRVWHADRGRFLLRTPGPVPFGLVYVLLVETNPFPNLSLFYRTMLFEYPLVLSRFCSLKISSNDFKIFSHELKISSNVTIVNMLNYSLKIWRYLKIFKDIFNSFKDIFYSCEDIFNYLKKIFSNIWIYVITAFHTN